MKKTMLRCGQVNSKELKPMSDAIFLIYMIGGASIVSIWAIVLCEIIEGWM